MKNDKQIIEKYKEIVSHLETFHKSQILTEVEIDYDDWARYYEILESELSELEKQGEQGENEKLIREYLKGYRKGLKQGYKDGLEVDKSGL